jgi:Helix-turn-helix domain
MGPRNLLLSSTAAVPTPSDGSGRALDPAPTAPPTTAVSSSEHRGAPGLAGTKPAATPARERFHSRRSAADFLDLSERTLERIAVEGDGPPFATVGRRVIYAESDLVAWMRARTVASTSAASAQRNRQGAA